MVAEASSPARRRRVEIVHESLLSHWPRLVRWRAEEIGGAQLRDELRQAAQVWEQHGRSDDFLWTGTALREYQLWRERYPGGLTALEEQFASAMIVRARRHQTRFLTAVAVTILLLVGGIVLISFYWRQSELARELSEEHLRSARAERSRAEAAKLLALGQLELESYPTAALAYTIRSLELTDTYEGRMFALRALSEGPPARFIPPAADGDAVHQIAISPSGEWMAAGGYERVLLFHRSGGDPRTLTRYPSQGFQAVEVHFGSDDVLVSSLVGNLRAISVPSGAGLWDQQVDGGLSRILPGRNGFMTSTRADHGVILRSWSLPDGNHHIVGRLESRPEADAEAGRLAWIDHQKRMVIRSLAEWDSPPQVVGETSEVTDISWRPDGRTLATLDASGDVILLAARPGEGRPEIYPGLGVEMKYVLYDTTGRWLMTAGNPEMTPTARLVDTAAPLDAEPLRIRGKHDIYLNGCAFSPDGQWLITANVGPIAFWPVPGKHPLVFRQHQAPVWSVAFTPDGQKLLSASGDGTVREWPLGADATNGSQVLLRNQFAFVSRLELDPAGERLAIPAVGGPLLLMTLDDGRIDELSDYSSDSVLMSVAFSRDGRHLAAAPIKGPPEEKVVRVWELDTGESRTIPIGAVAGEGSAGGVFDMSYLRDGRLLASILPASEGCTQLGIIDPAAATVQLVPGRVSGILRSFSLDPADSFLAHLSCSNKGEGSLKEGSLAITDLTTMKTRTLKSHGPLVLTTALDPTGTIIISGSSDGTIRAGRVTGEEPHVLVGHRGSVNSVTVSPDGRWIASAGDDHTVRLWPMPDLSKPPLHALTHAQLLSTLQSLTNLRVVEDDHSATGYTLQFGPFPGWEEVPEW